MQRVMISASAKADDGMELELYKSLDAPNAAELGKHGRRLGVPDRVFDGDSQRDVNCRV